MKTVPVSLIHSKRSVTSCDSVGCHRQQLWVESSPTWLTMDGMNVFMQSPEPSVLLALAKCYISNGHIPSWCDISETLNLTFVT